MFNKLLSLKRFSTKPIKIDFQNLTSQSYDLSSDIEKAFGLNGLGFAVITNIPSYPEYRKKVLASGYKLTHEPEEVIKSISKPEIHNAIGFDDIPFITKGDKVNKMFCSFTARNLRNSLIYPSHPEMERDHSNVWPNSLPKFKENFLHLGKLINSCQANLLRHMSNYITQCDSSFNNKLANDFKDEIKQDSYSRLITYFPPDKYIHEREGDKYVWDDWHTDYSLLTALTHPLYFTKEGEVYPSGHSSLNIKDRQGNPHEVVYEENELAIQASDALFILSGGRLLATPHSVRISKKMPLNLFRINLAVFFQPNYNYIMNIPGGEEFKDIIKKDPMKFEFENAPFKNGMDYGKYFEDSLDYLLSRK